MLTTTILPNADALDAIRIMIVTHAVNTESDPREMTLDAVIDELSEALHWDALDAGEDIDLHLAENQDLIKLVLAEYAEASCQWETGTESELAARYRTLEEKASVDVSGFSLL